MAGETGKALYAGAESFGTSRRTVEDGEPLSGIRPGTVTDGELGTVLGRCSPRRVDRSRLVSAGRERPALPLLPRLGFDLASIVADLMAHVLVAKYANDVPLFRMSQDFAREGTDFDRSTLADWLGKTVALLEPIADAIRQHVLAGQILFADTTAVSLHSRGSGTIQTSRLWAYARDERPWRGATDRMVLLRQRS